jgi:serine/threonine protein kinase
MDDIDRLVNGCPALHGYTVVRQLGEGGMGAVYLLKDGSGHSVALKVMLRPPGFHPKALDRFAREIANTTQLRHPNLVRLVAAGQFSGTPFYTMEFCAGGSVADLMVEKGVLSVPRAARITIETLDALEYCHRALIRQVKLADGTLAEARGVVHRDLKPGNIFLDGSGVAKVADLGLSKAFELAGLSAVTPREVWGGTPEFQPRQQILNFRDAGPPVDVWAAAASLYAMLTGRAPRDFPAARDPFETIMTTSPVPILKRDGRIPQAIAAVLDEALNDTATNLRFQSASEFRDTLRNALEGCGVC